MTESFAGGPEAFANAVRHIRKTRGLSQRDLATMLAVAPSRVARLEAGNLGITLASAMSLYRVMGFDVGLHHVFACPANPEHPADCSDWDRDGAVAHVDLAGRAFPAHGHLRVGGVPSWWGARYGWGRNDRDNTWWSHVP